jgi:hypothetical protein
MTCRVDLAKTVQFKHCHPGLLLYPLFILSLPYFGHAWAILETPVEKLIANRTKLGAFSVSTRDRSQPCSSLSCLQSRAVIKGRTTQTVV